MTINQGGIVVQKDDYYPFGGSFNHYQNTNPPNQYTYNNKELQPENQWLDYGARMYDANLGRFFNHDRFAEKYMDYNPYHYTLNNPIKYFDINGDSVNVSTTTDNDGNTTVDIYFKFALLNSSSNSNLNMSDLLNAINEQLSYSYSFGEANIDESWNVSITLDSRVVSSEKDVQDNEHLIEVRDPSDSKVKGTYDKAERGGDNVWLNEKYTDGIINGSDNNTVPHEVGHTFGLRHPDSNKTYWSGILRFWDADQYMSQDQIKKNPNNA